MKQFKLFISLMILSLVGFNALAADLAGSTIKLSGNSNTVLGKFEVKELASVDVNGEKMRAFELKYENAQKTVLIYLDEKSNCRDYIVRSKNLEVRYTCKKTSFGAQLLTGKQMQYKPELNGLFLAQDAFEKQQKISGGTLTVESALGLIASYYPGLLKSTNLLN
jgi:hypothetical protein